MLFLLKSEVGSNENPSELFFSALPPNEKISLCPALIKPPLLQQQPLYKLCSFFQFFTKLNPDRRSLPSLPTLAVTCQTWAQLEVLGFFSLDSMSIVQVLHQTRETRTAPLCPECSHLIAPLALCKFASSYAAVKYKSYTPQTRQFQVRSLNDQTLRWWAPECCPPWLLRPWPNWACWKRRNSLAGCVLVRSCFKPLCSRVLPSFSSQRVGLRNTA